MTGGRVAAGDQDVFQVEVVYVDRRKLGSDSAGSELVGLELVGSHVGWVAAIAVVGLTSDRAG